MTELWSISMYNSSPQPVQKRVATEHWDPWTPQGQTSWEARSSPRAEHISVRKCRNLPFSSWFIRIHKLLRIEIFPNLKTIWKKWKVCTQTPFSVAQRHLQRFIFWPWKEKLLVWEPIWRPQLGSPSAPVITWLYKACAEEHTDGDNLESFVFLRSGDKTGLQSVFIVSASCDLLITSSSLLCRPLTDADKMLSRARNLRRSQHYFSSHLFLCWAEPPVS